MCETAARQLGRANSPAKRRMIYSGNIAGAVPITALPRNEGARTFLQPPPPPSSPPPSPPPPPPPPPSTSMPPVSPCPSSCAPS
ncbi:hypothetical protein ALC60_12981 [Trachymyrmex zeteki]|uniref:Uncharacterized protein n=1 Tax=Mycetomoellerius zeteki TaxID=64791 RepID=A0A151WJL1_9HYME|nr:hypothetical protein ALC60_12981 [Trachymyrmex zeteki]